MLLSLLHNGENSSSQLLKSCGITYPMLRNEINGFMENKVKIFLPPSNGRIVYHFYKFFPCSLIHIFDSIVENELIRYSQKDALNDKFDMQIMIEMFFNLIRYKDQIDFDDSKTYDKVIEEFFKNKDYGLHSIGKDKFLEKMKESSPFVMHLLEKVLPGLEKHLTSSMLPIIEKELNKHIGVLCLTEDISNNPMWSHYASNYKGFALQFNAQDKYFYHSDESFPIAPVKYSSETPILKTLIDYIDISNEVLLNFFFCNKSLEWQYEKEWRIIKNLSTSIVGDKSDAMGNQVHLLRIPRDVITGIIFGLDFDENEKKRILEKIKSDERYKNIIPYDSLINRE